MIASDVHLALEECFWFCFCPGCARIRAFILNVECFNRRNESGDSYHCVLE
jgi:hypothetical protein